MMNDSDPSDACNPLPHEIILDRTKLKAFADDKLNVTKMVISVPQCLQKASFLDALKGVIVWERDNRHITVGRLSFTNSPNKIPLTWVKNLYFGYDEIKIQKK